MEQYTRLVLTIAFATIMYLVANDSGRRRSSCVTACIITWCAYTLVTSFAFVGYSGFIYLLLQFGALFALVNCKPHGFAPYGKFYTLTILAFVLATGVPMESWFQLWITATTVLTIVAYKHLKTLHGLMHDV